MRTIIKHLQCIILPLKIRVMIAGLTNNFFGKRVDLHDRNYRYVYKKFGHKIMLDEAKNENSWLIPK